MEDLAPEGPGPLVGPGLDEPEPEPVPESPPRNILLRIPTVVRTLMNSFRSFRLYINRPTAIPDMDIGLPDLVPEHAGTTTNKSLKDVLAPYPNTSSFLFGNWFWNGSYKKSQEEREKLLKTMLRQDFDVEELRDVNFSKIDKELAKDPEGNGEANGWSTSTLTIKVPIANKLTKAHRRQQANAARAAQVHDEVDTDAERTGGKKFAIEGFRHRSLVNILRTTIEGNSEQAKQYHWHPFEEYWQPPDPNKPPERIYNEIYSSPTFVQADRDLQNSPKEPGCDLPRAIASIMIWSDATHVAQFGQAKLWPIYLYLGNQSKYARCKPSEHAAHHAAYLPSVTYIYSMS